MQVKPEPRAFFLGVNRIQEPRFLGVEEFVGQGHELALRGGSSCHRMFLNGFGRHD
jgi:hypothetical protein